MILIYGLWWGFLRRWYGEGSCKGIWGNRGFQSAIMILSLLAVYLVNISAWQCWLASFLVSCWLVFQFWSRSVGEILDCGKLQQDVSSYSRWFRIPLDFIYKKLGKPLYTGSYDFWYCELRYTVCLLPLAFLSWEYLLPGLLSAPVYWLFDRIYSKVPEIAKLGIWWDAPKNPSEFVHGFIFGVVVFSNGWGL